MRAAVRQRYAEWVANYQAYAKFRGFMTRINDWPYVCRSFLECWAAPGFHRFWQVWNPGISYFVYGWYRRLGGNRYRATATVAAFLLSGFVHNVVALPLVWRWSWTLPVTFSCFGLLTVASRYLSPLLRQDRWPWPLNVAVNVSLVLVCFDVGFRVDRLV